MDSVLHINMGKMFGEWLGVFQNSSFLTAPVHIICMYAYISTYQKSACRPCVVYLKSKVCVVEVSIIDNSGVEHLEKDFSNKIIIQV